MPAHLVSVNSTTTSTQALTGCHTPAETVRDLEREDGQVAATKRKSIIRQSQLTTTIETHPKPAEQKKRVHYAALPTQSKSASPAIKETYVKPRAARSKTNTSPHDALPPTYFAAHLLADNANPLQPEVGVSLIAKVDSGCSPFSIISDALVEQAQLVVERHPTRLRVANRDLMESEYMVTFILRVVILDHPRLFTIHAVVWPAAKTIEPLLIGQPDALRTGLTVFVHDNTMRQAMLGQQALFAHLMTDALPEVPAVVATINSAEEDQDLLERISPIESFRAALQPASDTGDPWVNDFLHSDLAPLFGPISREPAKVPFLDFEVNESDIKQKTYANTIPIRLPVAAPRKQDSIDAHVAELLEYCAIEMAYPSVTPGPIASVAFTVAKAGVVPLPRPANMDPRALQEMLRRRESFSLFKQRLSEEAATYVDSLTSDRLVVSFKPVNDVSVVQHYPTPTVQENLQKLSRFKYFASVDLRKAFWSVGVSERCRKYLYTIAPGGLAFFWLRAPMGHSSVPGHFQFCIDGVLADIRHFAFAFADDIIIGGNSHAELKANIKAVLDRLLAAGFRVNASKCQFSPQNTIQYLGWIVGNGQVVPTEPFLDKLWRIKKPCEIKGDVEAKRSLVKRFLGTVQYLSAYIPYAADELSQK